MWHAVGTSATQGASLTAGPLWRPSKRWCLFDQCPDLQDPWHTAVEKLMAAWPANQSHELRCTIGRWWADGCFASMLPVFNDLRWNWTCLNGPVPAPEHAWPVLARAWKKEMGLQRVDRISQQLFFAEISGFVDYKRCLKTMAGSEQAAMKAWTQGSLHAHAHGHQVQCFLCLEPLTAVHLIRRYKFFEGKDGGVPREWAMQIGAGTSIGAATSADTRQR